MENWGFMKSRSIRTKTSVIIFIEMKFGKLSLFDRCITYNYIWDEKIYRSKSSNKNFDLSDVNFRQNLNN